MARFVVYDRSGGKNKKENVVIGQSILPLTELREGYRYITLHDVDGAPLMGTRINIYTLRDELAVEPDSPSAKVWCIVLYCIV